MKRCWTGPATAEDRSLASLLHTHRSQPKWPEGSDEDLRPQNSLKKGQAVSSLMLVSAISFLGVFDTKNTGSKSRTEHIELRLLHGEGDQQQRGEGEGETPPHTCLHGHRHRERR